MHRTFAVSILMLLASFHHASAASFPCANAKTRTEKIVCANANISRLDDELAAIYKKKAELNPSLFSPKQQRDWLEKRDYCMNAECVQNMYMERIEEIRRGDDSLPDRTRTKKCYILKDHDASGNPLPPATVCKVLESNLNKFCAQPPMVCGLKVSPEYRNKIVFPKWTPVKTDNLDLVERIFRAQWVGLTPDDGKKIWETERTPLALALKEHRLSVSSATLDLYNIGRPGLTYRIDDGACWKENSQLAHPSQWRGETVTRANIWVQQAPEIIGQLVSDYPVQLFGGSEVFIFDGIIYFYDMVGKEGYPNNLIVQSYATKIYPNKKNIISKTICEFDYN